MRPLVIHVPRNFLLVTDQDIPARFLSEEASYQRLLLYSDHLTDDLFGSISPEDTVLPTGSRVSMTESQIQELLKTWRVEGFGDSYRLSHPSNTSSLHGEAILRDCDFPDQSILINQVLKRVETFGRCLVIDCYLFSTVLSNSDREIEDVAIFVGADETLTSQYLRHSARKALLSLGYNSEINRPYGEAPAQGGHLDESIDVQRLMLEVRSDLYMDTMIGRPMKFKFEIQKMKMADVVGKIVAGWEDLRTSRSGRLAIAVAPTANPGTSDILQ